MTQQPTRSAPPINHRQKTTESLGSPDSLGKPAFKMLVKQLLAGDPMQPKAKDLDAAFAIADEVY
jgi:hypothetical protein